MKDITPEGASFLRAVLDGTEQRPFLLAFCWCENSQIIFATRGNEVQPEMVSEFIAHLVERGVEAGMIEVAPEEPEEKEPWQ